MDRKTLGSVTYEQWDKGEFGVLGAANAPEGSFDSLNLVVYRNGFLGPRHGAKSLGVTGVRTDAGPVLGLGWRGTPGSDLWWIQDTLVTSTDSRTIPDAAVEWTPGLDDAPTEPPQWVEYADDQSYVTCVGDKTYRFDHGDQTVNPLSGSPGGLGIAFYGDRMLVAGTVAEPQRVFISATQDPDDWSDGEFFDVPNTSGAIKALWVQRNHLTIWMANGEWWVVTGAAGTDSAFLRRVSGLGAHPWNANAGRGASLGSDDILFIPIAVDTPSRFDGATSHTSDNTTINDQDAPDDITECKVLRGMRPDEGAIFFPDTNRFGVYYNGQWTFHKFDTTAMRSITCHMASDQQGQILFADDGPGSPAPKLYTWTMNAVEHPGFSTSSLSMPGDNSLVYFDQCYVNFPEFWAPEGYEVRIRSVIVDLQEWDTGVTSGLNTYSVTPRSLSRYGNPSYSDGTPLSYSSAYASWTTGVGSTRRLRHVYRFGVNDDYGGGFQIRVAGIGGVAFQSIRATYQIRPETPRI